MIWTQDKCELILRLSAAGDSAGQIAKTIGATRNMVIGKLSRLRKGPAPAKPRAVPRKRTPVARTVPKPSLKGWQLLEWTDGCRFPVDDGPPMLFCNSQNKSGSSYCDEHHPIVFRPILESERRKRI
tara:strand:+ start:7518 stop:7898 length:381 start_codon:yes stop_codon:yes gene_type:complete